MADRTSSQNHRWFRFSLGTFLLSICMIAVATGWLVHTAREQVTAEAELERIGCLVAHDGSSRSLTLLELARTLLGEDEPSNIVTVDAQTSEAQRLLTDAGLVHLRPLTDLQTLFLAGTRITDQGLVHLEGLKRLEFVGLNSTGITDAGLVHLEGLTRLELVFLNGTHVTDVGSTSLQRKLPHCEIKR